MARDFGRLLLAVTEKLRRQEYQDGLAVFEPSYHAVAKQVKELQQREAKLRELAGNLEELISWDEAAAAILAILDGGKQ